jgi:TetR/AcrR family transcriptional repressor of lmrAB and yxaGH operons
MLQSGAQLFQRRGVSGTSFADVLQHSGAPRGSVYHHFPGGREQFAGEATALAGDFLAQALRAHSGDLRELADAQIDAWVHVLTNSDFTAGCPIAAGAVEGVLTPTARDAAGRTFEQWTAILSDQFAERGVAAEEVDSLALVVVSAIEGALLVCRARRDTKALEAVRLHLHRLLDEHVSD